MEEVEEVEEDEEETREEGAECVLEENGEVRNEKKREREKEGWRRVTVTTALVVGMEKELQCGLPSQLRHDSTTIRFLVFSASSSVISFPFPVSFCSIKFSSFTSIFTSRSLSNSPSVQFISSSSVFIPISVSFSQFFFPFSATSSSPPRQTSITRGKGKGTKMTEKGSDFFRVTFSSMTIPPLSPPFLFSSTFFPPPSSPPPPSFPLCPLSLSTLIQNTPSSSTSQSHTPPRFFPSLHSTPSAEI